MFVRVITKAGDIIWMKMGPMISFGRSEIAQLQKITEVRRARREAYQQGIEL